MLDFLVCFVLFVAAAYGGYRFNDWYNNRDSEE